ncbi:MAG: LysM peptidoglycan-binding domain-containing M23 family metallopeptidase [Chloroflexota bacterium]|nr:LysM peptidoglycan-binding domain-containing M23 family metallopeptidase [Chloroflexota bacterium]
MANALRKFVVGAWRLLGERQAVVSLLGRYSAHMAIIALAFLLISLQHFSFASTLVAGGPLPSLKAVAEPLATPTSAVDVLDSWQIPVQEAITRKALPYTDIPERVRLEVITYTVQANDTVWGIAEHFELAPTTIVWSNMEVLQGAPWLLQPGLTLDIPPVDGAYHTVGAGESVTSIAADYEVETATIYNIWNGLERGNAIREGQILVIPGGIGEDFDWEPPPPPAQTGVASANYSYGFCGNVGVSGPGANGWFGLPTGSYAVSGYVFHDPRNPRHNGLDYRCHLGDAIYAADNGVVVYAGWANGYGNLVKVDHGNGFMTYYAHLDSVWVSCGQAIYQGSVVGPCGTTGWSTGPHLHFEIRSGGVPQNPAFYQP